MNSDFYSILYRQAKEIQKPKVRIRKLWYRRYKIPEALLALALFGSAVGFCYNYRREVCNVGKETVKYFDLLEKQKEETEKKQEKIEMFVLKMNQDKEVYKNKLNESETRYRVKINKLKRDYEKGIESIKEDLSSLEKQISSVKGQISSIEEQISSVEELWNRVGLYLEEKCNPLFLQKESPSVEELWNESDLYIEEKCNPLLSQKESREYTEAQNEIKLKEYKKSDLERKTEENNTDSIKTIPLSTSTFPYPRVNEVNSIDRRIIERLQSLIAPVDIVDTGDGSLAINIGTQFYYRVGSSDLNQLENIYQKYNKILNRALYQKNRFKSSKMIEKSVRENLKIELRRTIMKHEKIE